MIKNKKQIFGIAILVFLIGWLVFYLYYHIEDFKQLSLVSPQLIFVLISIFLINYLITGIMTIEILRPLHIRLGIKEAFSIEFCGGPHVNNTEEIDKAGKFKIIKEEAVASGVRRIKAILE